ncbi:uncharacterized protein LOC124290898 [Haliotis rubra]|uniref:uncharacterized protein LOC124290898 n=1 Tax=Haliotis rubra TaxID=36100 RepID=UPI001EE5695E|nr:uncharacterized protein LOC124290898 [Haliotis rubra]
MKLASVPKAFGLTELKKGYFPHWFNLKENQNYVGAFPDPHMYGVDYIGAKDRDAFLSWYGQQHGLFDFSKEMKEYCISDVTVLREACLKFQQLIMEATGEETEGKIIEGVDPFANSITIASLSMNIFKTKFLKRHEHVRLTDGQSITNWRSSRPSEEEGDGSYDVKLESGQWISQRQLQKRGIGVHEAETVPSPIAQVPCQGYVGHGQYSKVSIQWLEWIMHSENIDIQHALNGGEHEVPGTNYRVDVYYPKTNTVLQFHGCCYHGCKTCFPHDRSSTIPPRTKQSVEELYALTCKKSRVLKQKGYKVVAIWEHEFHQQLKDKPDMKVFVSTLDIQDRLEPQDSFFGGRTNASTLHYKVEESEEIHYVNFTSHYPWVNKYCQYPIGHPHIIHKNFKSLDHYFGIAKVKILPPRKLYHPVLPYRSEGKLKFPLCCTCADKEQQTLCEHSDEQRAILGTWCTPEIVKAIEKGYQVIKVYEVYHWSETAQYNPETGECGLFTDYINTFLKLKQQASGWPVWRETEDDKEKYIADYREKEGIQLDKDRIEKNDLWLNYA